MARTPLERRLAAIMATDVVGYSRLMEANEEATLAGFSQGDTGRTDKAECRAQGRPDFQTDGRRHPGRI
jgi:class 3 adenylate cyclase